MKMYCPTQDNLYVDFVNKNNGRCINVRDNFTLKDAIVKYKVENNREIKKVKADDKEIVRYDRTGNKRRNR